MSQDQPVRYGDVFPAVSGDLASEPVAPRDAAMMQAAENVVLGQVQKGGAATTMQSAAARNERLGAVGHTGMGQVPSQQGVTVTDTELPGRRVITESVGGQVVGQYTATVDQGSGPATAVGAGTQTKPQQQDEEDVLTIGEALEATAVMCGDKPVERSDAAAIQAAEARATGLYATVPGGVAAAAQAAASANVCVLRDEDKTKLGQVLQNATEKLPADKPATRADAERVTAAELRNHPDLALHPGGVSASVAAAARLNQQKNINK